jgi:hypothetical protein
MCQFNTTTSTGYRITMSLCRGFVLVWLVLACFFLSPRAQAQLPNIFVADNPSGSVNTGGANIAYLQNTTGSDVTLTLDGYVITTKANRLNIFDRSSGIWVQKAVLNQQSQPVSTSPTPTPTPTPSPNPNPTPTPTPTPKPNPTPNPTPTPPPTSNTFLTGLYSYYKLDEPSNSAAFDALNGRTLRQSTTVGSTAGIINTSRYFPGNSYLFRESYTDFSPGANHFFTTFWIKAGTLNQAHDASFLGRFSRPVWEWLVWFNVPTHKIMFGVSADGNSAITVPSTTPISDTTNWYFVAAGWDGTNIKISVNGEPYATTSFTGPLFSGQSKFCLAAESAMNEWTGQIDEVAIWIGRNDLTISEVQQLYNNGAGLPFSSFH